VDQVQIIIILKNQLWELQQENRQLKACLKSYIEALVICGRDGTGHIDNELVKTSMNLCDMDERLIDFTERNEDESDQ
jgi:hypothetical protein